MVENPSSTELINQIGRAFSHRQMPDEVIRMQGRIQIDSDVEDGLWFQGREWQDLTNADWEQRHWGLTYLAPKAFAYYLPSILVLAIQNPRGCPRVAVDSFVWQLDHGPGAENLDLPLCERYLEFTDDEFEAIKEWLLWACESLPDVFVGNARGGPGDGFGRALDTLHLLQAEAEMHRIGNEGDQPLPGDEEHDPAEHDG
jgi:hypothetical protein